MLGCDPVPTASCTNPGGVGADRSGIAQLPTGGDGQLGTKVGDAAIVEKYSEEGATLLKNDDHALPLTSADLAGGDPRHRVEREPHGRRPDERGVDRVHRPRRGQPAQQLEALQREPRRVHVRARQRSDGQPVAVPGDTTTADASGLGGLHPARRRRPPTKDTPPATTGGQRSARSRPDTGRPWPATLYVHDRGPRFAVQQERPVPTAGSTARRPGSSARRSLQYADAER